MSPTSSASPTPAPAGIRREEGPLDRRVSSGPRLYRVVTTPEAPRAVIALLHGFADYGARYDHVARAWAERGLLTVAVDMRGHGRAQGARGDCRKFQEYLDDASEAVELVRVQAPTLPRFLFGHSFGGLVATSHLLDSPAGWRALVMTSPFFGFALKVPAAKRLVGKVASSLLPSFGLPSGLHGADLTHDTAIASAYDADPLVFKNARARWFTEAQAAQARAVARAASLTLPLYVAMGTQDRVSDLGVARAFFDAAGSADKTFDRREGLFHEVLNEPEWPDIAGRIAEWVLARAS